MHPELGQAVARTGAAVALGVLAPPPAAILSFLQIGKPQQIDCDALTRQAASFVEAAKHADSPKEASAQPTLAQRRDCSDG